MDIVDASTFGAVKQAIAGAFAPAAVEKFLTAVQRAGMRVRDFEKVVTAGKLGAATAAEYAKLSNGDQGQIREFYLASVEKVEVKLRDKHFKIYAYY